MSAKADIARRERKAARRQQRVDRKRALEALAYEPTENLEDLLRRSASMPSNQTHVVLALRVFQWFKSPPKS